MIRHPVRPEKGRHRDWIPVVDLRCLGGGRKATAKIAASIRRACTDSGFFYIVGHGVDGHLISELATASRRFFALPLKQKLAIDMRKGGRAWRGYFPVGRELTSGQPDQKEGIYFGAELDASHPKVRSKVPLFGPNLFPDEPREMRRLVLEYMSALTSLGHRVLEGIAMSLELEPRYFASRYTNDPLVLFRMFHYPALSNDAEAPESWSVGEHTDYGLLTILYQDDSGGLEVKSPEGWVPAPPVEGSFVCNIGDMLDRMTRGYYRSTPHRVRHRGPEGSGRLSFAFFFDPDFDAVIEPIDTSRAVDDDRESRWDRASVHEFRGTYGDYLLGKVSRVFPALGDDVL